MGQHKNPNRKPLPTRWILATKWFDENPTTKEVKGFWTPIGNVEVWAGRKRLGGEPFEYTTEQEATNALREILNVKFDDYKHPNLLFCALEVKYVPKRIKLYKDDWFKKRVVKEVILQVVQPKFSDTINP